jgi:predicted Fe-Mo cluster-binding NifX family protein
MRRVKIAVPTKTHAGLEDTVSEVFGKAETFTIVEMENGKIICTHIVDNPGAKYKYGSGPIAAKTLADLNVNIVLAVGMGLGASEILDHKNIKKIPVEPGMKVADVIRENLSKIEQMI